MEGPRKKARKEKKLSKDLILLIISKLNLKKQFKCRRLARTYDRVIGNVPVW